MLLLADINRSVLVVALSALSRVCKQGHVLIDMALAVRRVIRVVSAWRKSQSIIVIPLSIIY